jgi:hypothetical protein
LRDVDDQEFAASEVTDAFGRYLDSANDILELTGCIYRIFNLVDKGSMSDSMRTALEPYADQVFAVVAQNISGHSYPVLHPLVLTGSWGAFETMIVDVCKAMLRSEPALLESDGFKKATLPASDLLLDLPDQIDLVVDQIFGTQSQFHDTGTGKVEKQLSLVKLGGAVPDDLRKCLHEANAIRNIYLHNGGRVDKRFLERCPYLSYSIGDKFPIDIKTCARYVMGLHTYGTIILSRYRQKHGLAPIQCLQTSANPFKDSFNAMFPDAVPPETLI